MNQIIIDQEHNNKKLIIKMGDLITVSLKQNPTTGYRWQVDELNEKFIKKDLDYFTPSDKGIGSDGIRTFSFKPVSIGETKLQLHLKREWEKEKAPIDKFVLFIQIIETGP